MTNATPKASTMLNVNTLISTLGTVMIAVIGFLAKREMESIDKKLNEIVPRSEHTLRWGEDGTRFIRIEADLADVRTRLVRLEMEVRNNKTP